jgi:hypothetical protein
MSEGESEREIGEGEVPNPKICPSYCFLKIKN